MKHKSAYRIYEIDQDLINFLRGEGKYKKRLANQIDKQVYSHYGESKWHTDKYIGIIIEFQNKLYFAPLTHDGNRSWFNRDDTYDFELVYDVNNEYSASLLLCKALPLTTNLVKHLSYEDIVKSEGDNYAYLCQNEVKYINRIDIHQKIQDKMQACIYGKESSCKEFRVDYELAIKNVKEYNELKQQEQLLIKNKSNESGQGGLPSDDNITATKIKQSGDNTKASAELWKQIEEVHRGGSNRWY